MFYLFDFFNWTEIQQLLIDEAEKFWTRTIIWLPRVIIAVLIFILFKWLANKIHKLASYYFKKQENLGLTLRQMLALIVKVAVWIVGFIIILVVLKLEKVVLSLLAGFGIVGLGLSFAFQDLATNILSGVIIAFQRPFEIGEDIEVNNIFGKVHEINLRTTEIITPQGQVITVPNRKMIESNLINYSRLKIRRIDLQVGVSYAEDLQQVEKVLVETLKKVEFIKDYPRPEVWFSEFADSSINLYAIVWVKYETLATYNEQVSELIKLIHRTFNEHNITIPFPIRTLDFGIKGGKSLNEMLK